MNKQVNTLKDLSNRRRASLDLVLPLASRLTSRDRWICRLIWEHHVLTTEHLTQLAFDSLNASQHRLLILYRLRILDRFRPLTVIGSAQHHYVLDEMGAAVIAGERGIDIAKLGYSRERVRTFANSQHLAHLIGVNGFFANLAGVARRTSGAELVEWLSEPRCAEIWAPLVRPDGYGRWQQGGKDVDFFLEYDRGTETIKRVVDKLDGYRELATARGRTTPVLFWLQSAKREAAMRAVMGTEVAAATATPAMGEGPADAVWLPTGRAGPRVKLAQLSVLSELGRSMHSHDMHQGAA